MRAFPFVILIALTASTMLFGCSSEEAAVPPTVTGTCPPVCGRLPNVPKCTSVKEVETCPLNECMAAVPQSGDVSMLRIGRQLPILPDALVAITRISVNPNVNAKCFHDGRDAFNWLLKVDRKAGTLTTGGARASSDGKTYKFLDEEVDGKQLASICPGFVGAPFSLRPQTVKIDIKNNKFTSEKIPKINIPIYDGAVPIVLPLTDVQIKDAQISADGTCIGTWERDYWCDKDSLGWTTGGLIEGKISVADADKVSVKSLSCQSLCAILVNDLSKTDPATRTCKKNPDGSYPEIGDTCIGGAGCKNAWLLSSVFAASGVTIQ